MFASNEIICAACFKNSNAEARIYFQMRIFQKCFEIYSTRSIYVKRKGHFYNVYRIRINIFLFSLLELSILASLQLPHLDANCIPSTVKHHLAPEPGNLTKEFKLNRFPPQQIPMGCSKRTSIKYQTS